jgi:UDP-N-acetylmuramoylalanine--D-glutamate ligase
MEYVRDINNCTYVNDSKSTSIEALRMALQSYSKPIILICGGKHKGASYTSLFELIRDNCKEVYVFGQASNIMKQDWKNHPNLVQVDTVFEAIDKINNKNHDKDIVLFSPACSSFDQFANYEDRGRQFKHYIQSIKEK